METDLKPLARAASITGTTVVIDESISELGIDLPSRVPAAALGRAVLLGSVGKTVWGGVRVGWIRAEPSLIETLVRARSANDLGTAALDQLVVAALLPDFDRILADRRAFLRTGRDHVVAELRRRFPEWSVPMPAGGIAVWVGLGSAASSQLAIAARANGLMITAGPRFAADGAFERFIRVPFCLPIEQIDPALDVLQRSWASLQRGGARAPMMELAAVV